jgi:hypothetical protein
VSTCARVGCLRASHESGDRRYLPTNVRVQLDGVGTNWGRITFAHITNLVKMGVLGNTVVARNPVGNTHEDIDAIFAILRNHLIDLDVFSPSELDAAIRGALHSYSLPIFIKHVDGTRDYQAHYDPHIDRGLTGFGYSEYTNGYHVFKATPSCELDVAPACAFKKYQVVTTRAPARARARAFASHPPVSSRVHGAQQDEFFTVAINRTDLPPPWPPIGEFKPVPIKIDNKWGPCRPPLAAFPAGLPRVAAVSPYDYEAVKRDALHVLPDHARAAAARDEWRVWSAARPTTTADVDEATLPQWRFPRRPQLLAPAAAANGPAPMEVGGVPVRRVQHVNTVGSSLDPDAAAARGAQAARRGALAADNAAEDMHAQRSARDALEPGGWGLVRMNYLPPVPGQRDGCRIPWLLVQFPSSFEGVDTTKEDAKFAVEWCGFFDSQSRARRRPPL